MCRRTNRLKAADRGKKTLYIHYGDSAFSKAKFGPVKNRNFKWVKPDYKSGLWASPINSKWGWKDWCESEEFCTERLNKCFRFWLTNDAKVAHIYSVQDLIDLGGYKDDMSRRYDMCYLDFEKIARKYDAIELHLCYDGEHINQDLYFALYGWDCDSLLVLNPDVVKAA